MKILLLGATGRTGGFIVDDALAQGHEVVALARNPEGIKAHSPKLHPIKGSPESLTDVNRAIAGCQAVIVALNNGRASDSPFAKPVSPPHLVEDSVRNCLAAMKENGLRRIIVMSGSGVGDSYAHVNWVMRLLVKHSNLAITYADHNAVDALLRGTSGIDWTAVRPTMLTNTEPKALVVTYAGKPKPAMKISRKQVARFIVDNLENPDVFGKAPVLSER